MTVFLAAQEKLEMIFDGPMRSGIVLDSQTLLDRGYHQFQEELAALLTERYMGDWKFPAFRGRKNNLAFDVDSFQGETIIPRYVISRAFAGKDLAEILSEFHLSPEVYPAALEEDAGAPQESEKAEGHAPEPAPAVARDKRAERRPEKRKVDAFFTIGSLDIYLYDYGYASCTITGHITAEKDLTIQEYRSAAEHISSSLPDYTELFQSTLAKIARVLPRECVRVNFHDAAQESAFWPNTTLRRHVGELFWVHRTFTIPCNNQVDFIRHKTECRALVYSARSDTMDDVSLRADMAVFPGHGNSCVVYIKDSAPPWNVARLYAVTRAKNAFYAAMEDLDRDLFGLNNEIGLRGGSQDARFLEREAQYMSDLLARVNFMQSVYNDFDNQLDPQSIEIWKALRKVWIMDDMFHAIGQKVAMLDKAHDRTLQRLTTLQSKQIGALIVVFIMVALSAVIFGLLGVFPGGRAALGMPETILLAIALIGATLLAMRFYKAK